MGIKGLLPIIKPILTRRHISKYSNTRIGIDGHAWMHQIVPSVAYEIYSNIETDRHIKLFMYKVKNLFNYNITPVVVFDGDYLVSKEKTAKERKALKDKYMEEVEFYLQQKDIHKARELMKRCVSIKKEMIAHVIQALRSNGIEYIISPYEADAQLCFLQKIKYIDYIITEDSDLIVFGSTKVLYKFSGTHVEEYDSRLLAKSKDLFFAHSILDISILGGCDYLDSIRGIGIIKAHSKLKEAGSVSKFVENLIVAKAEVPDSYIESFEKAKITFLHHIVYNPYTKAREYLNYSEEKYEFLGTLEDLPFVVENNTTGDFQMKRHYLPPKSASSKCENLENIISRIKTPVLDKEESKEIDTNLYSPYFS